MSGMETYPSRSEQRSEEYLNYSYSHKERSYAASVHQRFENGSRTLYQIKYLEEEKQKPMNCPYRAVFTNMKRAKKTERGSAPSLVQVYLLASEKHIQNIKLVGGEKIFFGEHSLTRLSEIKTTKNDKWEGSIILSNG
jgi:hypothetical protein